MTSTEPIISPQSASNGLRPVLVAAPSGRDAEVLYKILTDDGITAIVCADAHELCQGIDDGAALAIVTEEALTADAPRLLKDSLSRQPEWSDFPLIVMAAARGAPGRSRPVFDAASVYAHTILLQRPVRRFILLSSVRTAIQWRARQYQVRDELHQRRRVEDALRKAQHRKDEFLATLGHELRNPLASLSSALDVICISDDVATLAESRAIMRRQVTQLTRLVDDLLDVSRITTGRFKLKKDRIDLVAVMCSAIENSRDLIEESRHTLHVTMPEEPIYMGADSVRLSQVLDNLLSNAMKYTPEGGQIRVALSRNADSARLSVHDNGRGIPPDMLEVIFEMFSQLDQSLETGDTGLGIGLSLTRLLVEMHGGRIEARSAGPGKGSEFTVWYPLDEVVTGGPAADEGASAMVDRSGPCRVLLVDDNRDAAHSMAMLLRLRGHEIHIAHDGLEALEATKQFRPELALLDIGLPRLNGYDVARRIRSQSGGDDITLAAVTGWGQADDRHRALEAGFDEHLTKPVSMDALEALLRTVRTS